MHFSPGKGIGLSNANAARVKRGQNFAWAASRTLLLLGVGFVILYPLMFMTSMSFKTYNDIVNPAVVWIPRSLTLYNYENAIRFMEFGSSFANSCLLGVGTAVLQTVSSAVVGYGFARFKFFGRDVLFGLVIFTLLVPPATIVAPQYVLMRYFDVFGILSALGLGTVNLINTPFAVYLPALLGMGLKSGIFIYLFRQYFRGQPKELDDAAKVDGCGYVRTFLSIMSPNAAAIYVTVLLFAIVWNWNDYYSASIFTDAIHTLPASLAIMRGILEQALYAAAYGITKDPYTQAACLMAGSFLTIAPVLALYVTLQRFFVQSIERSGIVG